MADAAGAPQFPDTSLLGKSDDGSEFIYGGSVGINRVLGYFHKTAAETIRPSWPLMLVNLYTVFRNCYAKDLTDLELDALVTQDCDLLSQYVAAYAAAKRHVYNIPGLVFYCPTYRMLPKDLLRTPSPSDQLMNEAYERFRASVGDKDVDIGQTGSVYRWVVPVGTQSYPHREVLSWLDNHSTKFEYVPGRDPVLLLSHCPVDLHMAVRLPTLRLIESYQGVIKTPTEFGTKLGAGPDVPFNLYTHRVFGDKVHLAPLVKGAEKKALLQVAEARSWQHRTASDILADITKTVPALTASELIRVKL